MLRGLKAKIGINLGFFFLLGMAAIDLVITLTAQQILLRTEADRARSVSALLASALERISLWEERLPDPAALAHLRFLFDQAGASCLLARDGEGREVSFGEGRCLEQAQDLHRARPGGKGPGPLELRSVGTTFGLFWTQPEHLAVTAEAPQTGGRQEIAVLFPLAPLYRSLRSLQQVVLFFIFLNAALLSLLAVYRVFKITLQPLGRLARRAEEYNEDDERELFSVRKEDNELKRLSLALNGLLRRLSSEKAKLRQTVASLEAANAELRRAQSEILRAEKLASVGRLSAGIAHEIGNPIGIVSGYLELLKDDGLAESERRECLERAGREIERISAIIRQLLEISRPAPEGTREVSVHAILSELAQVMRLQPFCAHLRIETEPGAACDRVRADADQLRQVFLNLAINAADAVSARGPGATGSLSISTANPPPAAGEEGGRWLEVAFRDDGVGIEAERIPCIFDPFFTTKEPGKGTGLGLAVSYMIVERAGGRMEVESAPGRGTCMRVRLPLARGGDGDERE
ncbi:MAG: ATP-binding protein [Desulfobacterales bacterium]